MKQELELNYQTSLLNKERDWSLLLADRDKKISSLSDNCKKLKATNEDMRMVVAEFEKTISQLQGLFSLKFHDGFIWVFSPQIFFT